MKIKYARLALQILFIAGGAGFAHADGATAQDGQGRAAKMAANITACEQYLATQGVTITLPRPPERPSTQEQWSALRTCHRAGIMKGWHHRRNGGSQDGSGANGASDAGADAAASS